MLITEQVLGNAAHALAGMIAASPSPEAREARRRLARPAVGMTMFGVTTPAVQGDRQAPRGRFRLPGIPRDRRRAAGRWRASPIRGCSRA